MTADVVASSRAAGRSARRIILVANTDWYLFNFRLSLARAIRDLGWEAILVSPGGRYTRRLTEAGFRWLPLSLDRRGVFPLAELKTLFGLRSIYRRLRPDLVHHHTLKPVLYGTLAARWAGVPGIVNSVTGLGFVFLSSRPGARLLRPLVGEGLCRTLNQDGVYGIFENAGDRESLLARGLAPADRHTLIEGVGVDLERFTASAEPKGEPVVLMASRMLWDKGVGDFVEASRRLRQEGHQARFALVGAPDPGNPSSISTLQIRRWAQSGVVEWWGHSDDMPHVLGQCHIVVLPSRGEGVPTVLLEAAASGRPVVASDIAGCREVLRPGETGLLVPPGNPLALAQAIASLLGSPDERARMGRLGRDFMKARFDQVEINRRTIMVYQRVLQAADGTPDPHPAGP